MAYEYALANVSSFDLKADWEENKALFYRRMWSYLRAGIPKFDKPLGISRRLAYVSPAFDDVYISADTDGQTVFETSKTGFEICVASVDGDRIPCEYDAETGTATLENGTSAGTEVCFDFATDGHFIYDLTDRELDIIGLCWLYMWETNLGNVDIERKAKVRDKSTEMPAESALTNANTARAKMVYNNLQCRLEKFENDLAALQRIPGERLISSNGEL